jgi:hypothetical protein
MIVTASRRVADDATDSGERGFRMRSGSWIDRLSSVRRTLPSRSSTASK